MDNDLKESQQEISYLTKTIDFIANQLSEESKELESKEDNLIAFRKEMYENASHDAKDFSRLADTVQYLNPLTVQTMDYQASQQRINLYKKMAKVPYFARVDFDTEEWGNETIYIGIGNLENEDTFECYVYDWRAPISSVFYRFELGRASYTAPAGEIEGNITLKRQFEIENGKLEYFFDSTVNIVDDILKEALSKNSSTKMRTIVETIQREQDIIIRDIESDLLIVQGVAGSGKTSIALHRAAYLMYEGLNGHISANNMILISPNDLFARYISDVLPGLGESNIETITFEKLLHQNYEDMPNFTRKNEVLEEIMTADPSTRKLLQDNIAFKSSPAFLELLNRFINYFEHRMIPFADVMYAGNTIAQKELLKSRFLESSIRTLPVPVRLNHIEAGISAKIQQLRPQRLKKLEDFMSDKPERALDFKTAARLLNTKQVSSIIHKVRKFTRIDYNGIYQQLFSDRRLFFKLTHGLALPENIDDILTLTDRRLAYGTIDYSDAMAIFLLKLKMDSAHSNTRIRQVVVDEAQDYSPVHFEILSKLFPSAKYTVLGDINQTMVDTDIDNLYQSVAMILNKKRSTTATLNKSFRCSYEIASFAQQFCDKDIEIQQLNRFEASPELIYKKSEDQLLEALLATLAYWKSKNYNNIAVICKSGKQAKALYESISHRWDLALFTNDRTSQITDTTAILPIYLAKGLEFDAVAVFGVDEGNYYTDDDRRLLYIATTRALHRLALFHTGSISKLIKQPPEGEC